MSEQKLSPLVATSLGLGFLVEIAGWYGFACLGLLLSSGLALRIASSIALFLAVVVFWSIYMAPKAPRKFAPISYYIVKTVIYTLGAYGLSTAVSPLVAVIFVVAALVAEPFLYQHNLSRARLPSRKGGR